jgi:hypothetical protein
MSKEDITPTFSKHSDRESPASDEPQDGTMEKKAVRKLDFSVVPLMSIFYLLSYLVKSSPFTEFVFI